MLANSDSLTDTQATTRTRPPLEQRRVSGSWRHVRPGRRKQTRLGGNGGRGGVLGLGDLSGEGDQLRGDNGGRGDGGAQFTMGHRQDRLNRHLSDNEQQDNEIRGIEPTSGG